MRRYGRRVGLALRTRALLLKEALERLKQLFEVAEVLGTLEAGRRTLGADTAEMQRFVVSMMRQKSVGSGGDVAAALRRRWSSTADGAVEAFGLRRPGPLAEAPRGAHFPRGSPTSACKAARWAVSLLSSLGIGLPVPGVGFKNLASSPPGRGSQAGRRRSAGRPLGVDRRFRRGSRPLAGSSG